ncbi:UNVERIFIED_CONTAM: hypothetical protein GTU68_013064 [Idotea baltica]|nr:hypothetical protein [Idotea baltica]
MLLAIETSCDETALAICREGSYLPIAERIASQIDLHREYGGVVPELAARQHLQALPVLLKSIFSEVDCCANDISAVAVTVGPGLQGCLLVGVSFAKAFCQSLSIPLFPVHHIEGHIAAIRLSPDVKDVTYPSLALVVSGGHTMIVEISAFRDYRLLAETRDDAAGEAFDKIASLLKLPYPGGPSLSKLAEQGDHQKYSFPRAVAKDLASFSFSGLKTAVSRVVSQMKPDELESTKADVAASAQAAIVDALVDKLFLNFDPAKHKSVILTGGVAANSLLREKMLKRSDKVAVPLYIPPVKYCTDNAAMIAVIGTQLRANQDNAEFDLGARARWPFSEAVTG